MEESNLIWFFMLGGVLALIIRYVFSALDLATQQKVKVEREARRARRLDELYGRNKNEETK